MNKICGYSCEHNKGGVCQITMCDKQLTFSTTTEKNIEELKQMIEPLKNWKYWEYSCMDENVKKAMENKSYIEVVLEEQSKTIKELQQKLQRKDNIINAIKEELKQKQEYYRYRKDNRYRTFLSYILDKIKELEGKNE